MIFIPGSACLTRGHVNTKMWQLLHRPAEGAVPLRWGAGYQESEEKSRSNICSLMAVVFDQFLTTQTCQPSATSHHLRETDPPWVRILPPALQPLYSASKGGGEELGLQSQLIDTAFIGDLLCDTPLLRGDSPNKFIPTDEDVFVLPFCQMRKLRLREGEGVAQSGPAEPGFAPSSTWLQCLWASPLSQLPPKRNKLLRSVGQTKRRGCSLSVQIGPARGTVNNEF